MHATCIAGFGGYTTRCLLRPFPNTPAPFSPPTAPFPALGGLPAPRSPTITWRALRTTVPSPPAAQRCGAPPVSLAVSVASLCGRHRTHWCVWREAACWPRARGRHPLPPRIHEGRMRYVHDAAPACGTAAMWQAARCRRRAEVRYRKEVSARRLQVSSACTLRAAVLGSRATVTRVRMVGRHRVLCPPASSTGYHGRACAGGGGAASAVAKAAI